MGAPPPVSQIGKYEIVDVLGRGGMGVVYRAIDKSIGRKVAIKTLTQGFAGDPEMLARFYDEARRTGGLKHPNIVTVYDLGDYEGSPYIVMEYVEGEPLDRIIAAATPLPLIARLQIIEEVCSALGYAHRNNVIHRDVKPANIFVQSDGVTKLLDFGIARLEGRDQDLRHTRVGSIIGTVPYMAPERLRDEAIDGRSDIFATGVVLYQLLTGRLPFTGEDVVLVQQLMNEKHPPLSTYLQDCPLQLEQIVDRALAKAANDRYSTADEMAVDLFSAISDLKQEQVLELFPQARGLMEVQDYTRARTVLQSLLKIDSKHLGAKQLLAEIQHHLVRRQQGEKVLYIRQQAEDALYERKFDQCISLLEEGQKLDPGNTDLAELLEKARQQKQIKERIDEYLRQADAARRKGDFQSAIASAQQALKIDTNNSKIMAVCKMLAKEAEDAQRAANARRLRESARTELSARRYVEALELLKEAEKLDPADPELQLLVGDANAGLEQMKRRRLVERLQDEAAAATSYEQLREVSGTLQEAIVSMPAEASLFLLKVQVDRQLKEYDNRRLVEDTIQASRSMQPVDALELVRRVLQQVPGNERLVSLESILAERMRQQTVEERRTKHLIEARDALKDGMFAEAVRILKECRAEGIASAEMVSLLEFAQREEAEHRRLDVIQDYLVQGQELLRGERYDEAIGLLQSALRQTEDPVLRKLMEKAFAERDAFLQRIEGVLQSANKLIQEEQHDLAIKFLQSQPKPILQSIRVQLALSALKDDQDREALKFVGYAYSTIEKDLPSSKVSMQQAMASSGESSVLQSVVKAFDSRKSIFADKAVSRSIAQSQAAARGGDREGAIGLLQGTASALEYASPELRREWQSVHQTVSKAGIFSRLRGRFL